jgi:hypothetical protein
VLLGALALVAAIAALGRDGGRAVAPQQSPPEAPEPAADQEPAASPPAFPHRDLFRYADEPIEHGALSGLDRDSPIASAPRPGPEVRLVGLVRRAGTLSAALAFGGEVFLLGPGEELGGFTLLEILEDGVLVRRPDGAAIRLSGEEDAGLH